MPLAVTLAQVASASGYGPDDPLVIAVRRGGGRPAYLMRGCLPAVPGVAGRLGPKRDTVIYVASLAKQVTAACVALAGLDPESVLADHLPELPSWARAIRLRHLISHTAGLPLGNSLVEGRDRTTAGMLTPLSGPAAEPGPPGVRFEYSNVGYVLLAEAVARAVGESLAEFARRRVFEPLGMSDTLYWNGPAPTPPGAVRVEPVHPAPLAIGGGGMWSTAADLMRWAVALDEDRLGITEVVQAPGRLDDGTELDYAWGMGVRELAGRRLYRHGGSFADVRAMLVRVPEEGFDLVILTPADRTERRVELTDRLLDTLSPNHG